MNPFASLRRRVQALFADACADLRELSLDDCVKQVQAETRAMMCAEDRTTIGRHAARQRFLRRRIAVLKAESAETTAASPTADNDVLRAMPPR